MDFLACADSQSSGYRPARRFRRVIGLQEDIKRWLRHLPATVSDGCCLTDSGNVVFLFYKDPDSGPFSQVLFSGRLTVCGLHWPL